MDALHISIKENAMYWKSRAKVRYALEGDENTKFFHASATCRMRRNTIPLLTVDWVSSSDHANKASVLKTFYSDLLGSVTTTVWHFELSSLYPDAPDLPADLSPPFTHEEIKNAFFSMNRLSSPGPEGFGAAFYSTFWTTVALDVFELFASFFEETIDLARINRALLVLLPKVDAATHPSQFCPISLQNCVMKAITNVLTSRLQKAIQTLVDADQTGFLSGRRISENIAYAADLLRCSHSRKAHTIVFRIDFCKAFDSSIGTTFLLSSRLVASMTAGAAGWKVSSIQSLHRRHCLPPAGRDLGELSTAPSFLERIVEECLPLYRSITRVTIGDGRSTSFWLDRWLPGSPLVDRFPAIYSHSTRLHASMSTVAALGLDLQPHLSSVAEAELLLIHRIIDDTRLGGVPDDRFIESPSTPRLCSWEAYRMLSPPRPQDASACISWSLRLPTKLKIFVYLLDIDRLSTRANLFYKSSAPSDICDACPAVETRRHLFFDCHLATFIWSRLDVPIPPGSSPFGTSDPPSPSSMRLGRWGSRRSSGPFGRVATILSSMEGRPP
ncbi:hypothetical protein QYE76_044454 [Lolium multiflorum]|uniref:Reverse transcriptase zinc-binding domain-containing protein n=1 Tax=Lolium multiflorum TaxID=4521 RepID=A0AAD8TL39_LOLMU|nr:hypothetical protein QYE76_044454 [Lolium multiflorum]